MPKTMPISVHWKIIALVCFLVLPSLGYCGLEDELNSQIKIVEDFLFGKGIRTVVMLFGFAWGFIKSSIAGSFVPLCFYGGMGFIFFFLPKIIHLVGGLGG